MAAVGRAHAAQPPARLSPEDLADIARVEAYFNAIRTLRARFVQVADNGAIAEGTFYLSRPGRLRLEYDPPDPNLLVANGTFLIHYDSSLGSVAHLPLNSTPAGILVREKVAFAGDLAVTQVERSGGALRLTVTQTEDPQAGRITFVFGDKPLQLVKWQVIDGQGRRTEVSLAQAEVNIALDPALFRFKDPNFPG
jgi:outer membrane lipoprotein-sorting protein